MVGQTISQYRITRELGRGAMGVVYLAEHVVLGRKVAIKTVSSNYGRFLREARAASNLSHPHIATIHDYGKTASGQPYIVMEYVEGKTLADLISQQTLTIPKSLRIVREVAEALSEAHRHNIIHRDIKPSNIAVDDRGIVKVLDFGMAKQIGLDSEEPDSGASNSLDTRTREGVLVGTPMYFSPEQARGLPLDPRSDLFSLGLVLYECLCGKPAFSGATPMDICARVIRDDPVPPSAINPAISTDVERVTLRALEKAKDKRYQSAGDLASDLQTLELTFSTVGRLSIDGADIPPTKTEGTDRNRKLKRLAIPVLAVLIIGVVLGLIILSSLKQSATQPEQVRLGISGNVIEAALSPDGTVVAYITDENGRQSIWLRQLSTRTDRQLVSPADTKYKGLAFFPNGDYLSYLKTEGTSADLYQVSTFGGSPRKLTSGVDTPVSFSPDGKQFTFVRYFPDAHLTTLLIADSDGSNEKPLAELYEPQLFSRGGVYASGPAWSPDGKLIAVPAFSVTEKTYREIILVNVADGSMNTITRGRWSMIEKIVWLANGSGFLMNASTTDSQLLQIWQVNLNGDQVQQVTKDPSHYVGLSTTKDSAVVLTIKNERISGVWVKTGESDPVPVVSSRYLGVMGIAWTTDGKFVLASNSNGNYELLMMEADGDRQQQLTVNERSNIEPAVSADGRYIIYVSYEGRHPHLWRMNADGTNPTQLTSRNDEDLPRFTPDGKWVVYHAIDQAGYSIRKVSIDGGDPITLVSGDYSTQPDVSPDGKQVACLARRGGSANLEILVVPIDGGAPASRFALPPTVDAEWPGLRWTFDGTEITYVSTVEGVSNIWGQPLTSGKAKQLTDFSENRIFFFDWSRNERKLVLVRGNDTRDLILVRDFLNAK